jgi:hypothetical protein
MSPFTIARSSAPQKPPALSKNCAVRLWFANRELRETNKALVQSKGRHKAAAASATKRCSEQKSRLSEIERRAAEAKKTRIAAETKALNTLVEELDGCASY